MSFIKSLKGYKKYLSLKNDKQKTIYFFSESKNYRNHFEDIIFNLSQLKKYRILYFTSDLDDIEAFNSNVETIYIGKGLIRMIFFTFLSCDIMLMTLTDLDNHEIKRSKKCKSYVYLFHSLCSTFKSYTKNAFNNYDVILANGQHQIDEIRKNEKLFNLKKKEIFNIGYPYIENLKRKINTGKEENVVLFAPSWSNDQNDLLENYGEKIVEILLKDFRVFLRPHPQSLIKSKKYLNKILRKFSENKNFIFNKNLTDLRSFDKSSILLTDNGGICLEYYTLYEKPFICINHQEKIHNKDYKLISEKSVEEEFRDIFSYKIDISNLKDLNSEIKNAIKNFQFKKDKLEKFFESYSINFDQSAKRASAKIEQIVNS